MTCRHCGTTIAANALICYRCGTATAEPHDARSAAPVPSRDRITPVWLVLALTLALLAGLVLTPGPAATVVWVGAAAATVVAVVTRLRRSRR